MILLKTVRVKVEIQPRRHERGVGTILYDMLVSVHDSVRHIFVQSKPESHMRTPCHATHQIRSEIQDGQVVIRIGVEPDLCCLADYILLVILFSHVVMSEDSLYR